jgi:hypothetical protein
MRTILGVTALVVLSPMLAGCNLGPTLLHEQANSFARASQTTVKSYVLLPLDPKIDPSDFQFREYSAYVAVVLESRGLRPAPTVDQADLLVLVGFGAGEPREHYYAYSTPEFGQIGVASSTSTTDATVVRTPYAAEVTATTRTSYQPTYGVTGSTTHVGSYTTCLRWIVIRAWDRHALQSGPKTAELWRTTLRSDGTTCDLRAAAPVMVAAARTSIGTNTGQAIELKIDVNSNQIQWIKSERDRILARPTLQSQTAALPNQEMRERAQAAPTAAVGYRLGAPVDEVRRVCESAGAPLEERGPDLFRCAKTASSLGLDAVLMLRFCAESLCQIDVRFTPSDATLDAWMQRYQEIENALRRRYGTTISERRQLPSECAAKYQDCFAAETAAFSVLWKWTNGNAVELRNGRADAFVHVDYYNAAGLKPPTAASVPAPVSSYDGL